MVYVKSSVSLLILGLVVFSIIQNGILKSPCLFVVLSFLSSILSFFGSCILIFFHYIVVYNYIFLLYYSFHLYLSLLLVIFFDSKAVLSDFNVDSFVCSLFVSICTESSSTF